MRYLSECSPAPSEVTGILGTWWWMGMSLTAGWRGGELVPVEIGETLRVRRDPHGVPAALEIRTFVFVRDPWPSDPK
ncbi:MAG: hypothetical protein ACR2F6_12715 [Mycobacteriales bacterium]